MLDRDLSILYGVETRVLNQAVKRNITRFPEDFMFQLTKEEMERKYDYQFKIVFDAIKQLLEPPVKPKEKIGFKADNK